MATTAYDIQDDDFDSERDIHDADVRRILGRLLRELEPRQEMMIRMRYGIGVEEMTETQIMRATGIPMGQVHGALDTGLRRMRHRRRMRILQTALRPHRHHDR